MHHARNLGLVLAGALIALPLSPPLAAQSSGGQMETSAKPPMSESGILARMHHINQMEIQIGKLAKQRGTTDQIRDYGDRLVRDHSFADQKVMLYAQDHNLVLPMASEAGNSDSGYQKLAALNGLAFDRQFTDMMERGHESAIAMLVSAQDNLPANSQLRVLIGRMLPILNQHYVIASRLGLTATAYLRK